MDHDFSNDELWKTALGSIEVAVSHVNFKTWFKNTHLVRRDEKTVLVCAPNIFTREWLENKYHSIILDALKRTDGVIEQVLYEVSHSTHETTLKPFGGSTITITKRPLSIPQTSGEKEIGGEQYDASSNLNTRYTFENFIIGSNNELAYAACQAVARQPGMTYNPLFIYGGVGLGKTHLLQATGNYVTREQQRVVKYVTSEKFTHEMISAIGTRSTSEFKNKYRAIDVLIIDDIQFLAGKEKTQEEFFHTFNELYGYSKQIIISSDRPPKAIPTLEERLRSRFEGGMIVDISSPDLETRVAILEAKAKHHNLAIPQNVLQYIATSITTNIRELEGTLNRVVASHQLQKTTLSLDSVKEMLHAFLDQPKRKVVRSDRVIEVVSGYFRVPQEDLVGKCRRKDIVRPRQIVMYLLREDSGSSFPVIGNVLGGRDHTTAMHACEKINKELEHDDVLRQDITSIRQQLYTT